MWKGPFLMMEILPCYTTDNEQRLKRQQSIEGLLNELSYRIFRIIKSDGSHFVKFESIENIGIHGDMEMCEYVMAPKEIEDKICDY